MSHMMEEDDPTGQSGESSQTPLPSTAVNQQTMEIIQTSATNFTEAIVQNPGAQQNIGQIITSYAPMTGSFTPEIMVPEKMEEEKELTIMCVVCQEEYAPAKISFSCTKCVEGKLCDVCMPQYFSTWKAKALQDCGLTIDTGQQVYFVYSKHLLFCPFCKAPITPVTYDPALAWYKQPSFPPPDPGRYAVISGDNSTANLDGHSFKNGFGRTRYFNDYPAYLLAQPQLPGDCPHCGEGNGLYVKIKAKDAATLNRDPWRGGPPSCLICPSARNFGQDEDLFYCIGCQQSILHPKHFSTTGQVEKGTFYTVVFQ